MNDKEFGLRILRQYFDAMKFNYSFSFTMSFAEFLNIIESRKAGKTFAEGLGLGANLAEMDLSETYDAMYSLAKKSQGKIPATNGAFTQYLIDKATSVSFIDAVVYTTKGTTEQLTNGVTSIGDTIITTGKFANYIFPLAFIVLVIMFAKRKSEAW